MATNLNIAIGDTVRALTQSYGLRTVDVQEAIGVSHGTMFNRLNGKNAWTAEEVVALANLFGISVDYLLTGVGGSLS